MKYKAAKKNKYIKRKLYNNDDKALITYKEFKDEKKVNIWIIKELEYKIKNLKKDVKKNFDDIIKILDFVKKWTNYQKEKK